MTTVQMRTRCGSMKPDLATSGPESTPINASVLSDRPRNTCGRGFLSSPGLRLDVGFVLIPEKACELLSNAAAESACAVTP